MESLSLRLMVQILPAIKQQRSRTVKACQQGAQRVVWGHSDNGQHFCLASRESGFDSQWFHDVRTDVRNFLSSSLQRITKRRRCVRRADAGRIRRLADHPQFMHPILVGRVQVCKTCVSWFNSNWMLHIIQRRET